NTLAYVLGNPVLNVDPLGLFILNLIRCARAMKRVSAAERKCNRQCKKYTDEEWIQLWGGNSPSIATWNCVKATDPTAFSDMVKYCGTVVVEPPKPQPS